MACLRTFSEPDHRRCLVHSPSGPVIRAFITSGLQSTMSLRLISSAAMGAPCLVDTDEDARVPCDWQRAGQRGMLPPTPPGQRLRSRWGACSSLRERWRCCARGKSRHPGFPWSRRACTQVLVAKTMKRCRRPVVPPRRLVARRSVSARNRSTATTSSVGVGSERSGPLTP